MSPSRTSRRPPTRRPKSDAELCPRFLTFWQTYPRKVAKPDAAKAFASLAPDDALLAAMLAALDRQCRSPDWARDGGRYVPHPATWLNGKRWTDEGVKLPPPAPTNPTTYTDPRAAGLL